MKISINKAHFPVTVLGPGRRLGIWLQGCSIGCKACVSQDTWPRDPGRDMPLVQLLAWCRQTSNDDLDGVTISGGEPFDQPEALAALLDGLQLWRTSAALDFDILCYSGYPLATLQKQHAAILQRLDALIPEPYVDARPLTHVWRGSSNQPLLALSERGRQRYAPYLDAAADPAGKRIQTMLDQGRVWYVGIPGRGDMQALAAKCAAAGMPLTDSSWRS